MTSRIRLVGLSTATAKQEHRPRSTKLGAPSLWELSIDPVDTPEGREPLRGGVGGQGNQEREYSYYWRKTPNGLGVRGSVAYPCSFRQTAAAKSADGRDMFHPLPLSDF